MTWTIHHGDNRDILKTLPDNSIDSIVTDPPYGIDFLGKAWDANTGALETYQECLRVLKPGGHILAFSAPRTYHHLAVTLEQAGFEIRDQIMWIYSSGFPKSQDVGRSIQRSLGVKETKQHKNNAPRIGGVAQGEEMKQKEQVIATDPEAQRWSGWGTALKPAHEPICLARKPIKLSIARNVQHWGVGALNIDATRIPTDDLPGPDHYSNRSATGGLNGAVWNNENPNGQVDIDSIVKSQTLGRFPANVIGDIPDYQKYFYCPKVSRAERHLGFDDDTTMNKHHWLNLVGGKWVDANGNLYEHPTIDAKMCWIPGKGKIYIHGLRHEVEEILRAQGRESEIPDIKGNNHPTVKPIALMRYLIQLVTPPGGTVLDPFNGSGSTGCAAVELGMDYVGCELDENYVRIAETRIQAWQAATQDPLKATGLFE